MYLSVVDMDGGKEEFLAIGPRKLKGHRMNLLLFLGLAFLELEYRKAMIAVLRQSPPYRMGQPETFVESGEVFDRRHERCSEITDLDDGQRFARLWEPPEGLSATAAAGPRKSAQHVAKERRIALEADEVHGIVGRVSGPR